MDPNGILSPGKSGIWPKAYRGLRQGEVDTTEQLITAEKLRASPWTARARKAVFEWTRLIFCAPVQDMLRETDGHNVAVKNKRSNLKQE